MMSRTTITLCLVLSIVALAGAAEAQLPGPAAAEITPLVANDGVHAGSAVRAALRVRLPEGYHTNSNKPRDPLLIPITLTVNPPAGVTVSEIVWPDPIDLQQRGVDQALRVFEREFVVGVQLTLASGVPTGELTIPASLRYQACNETMCFVPKAIATGWTFRVVSAKTRLVARDAGVFSRIPFGHGEPPTPPAAPAPPPAERT